MEGEVTRMIFQTMEISFRVARDSARGAQHIIAFLLALAKQHRTKYGETSLGDMLKTGETLMIGMVPSERMKEFRQLTKKYGIPYHSVEQKRIDESGIIVKETDVMFKNIDLPKYNTIRDRMGLAKEEVAKYEVTDVRESAEKKLEKFADEMRQPQQKSIFRAHHRVSEMDMDELRDTVMAINLNEPEAFTPENWQAYLEVQALLYDYSDRNKERIAEAGGTVVMSKTRWKELGREPLTNAEGIEILMPELVNGRPTGKFDIPATVYDVSETMGADVSVESYFTRINNTELDGILQSIAGKYKVEAVDELSEDAVFDPDASVICMKNGLSRDEKFKALYRESIYAKAFHEQGTSFTREANQLLAESMTYAVSTKYGIDASEYTFEYLAQTNPKEIISAKGGIVKGISEIAKEFKQVIKRLKNIGSPER